jgi:hypothetical protein
MAPAEPESANLLQSSRQKPKAAGSTGLKPELVESMDAFLDELARIQAEIDRTLKQPSQPFNFFMGTTR